MCRLIEKAKALFTLIVNNAFMCILLHMNSRMPVSRNT